MGISDVNYNRAVFLDRDGVINPPVGLDEFGKTESPLSLKDFNIFPWTARAIKKLNDIGFYVFVVTNQPAVAKGKIDSLVLDEIHYRFIDYVTENGGCIRQVYVCRHHPDPSQVKVQGLLKDCDCRKPKPGMLLQAAKEHNFSLQLSWMMGDTWKDIQAGQAAGCRTILIHNEIDNLGKDIKPDFTALNLLEAVRIIEGEESKP